MIPPAAADIAGAPWPPRRVAWYAVFVFALSLMINFLNRGIVGLLVEQIKADLKLSDTQMGAIMGFAFVAFYAVLGLPIARLIDRGTRRTIFGIGIILWSLMTAACGLAGSFWQLLAARFGVGVGEACTGPAVFSMLSDMFPRHKLPKALAVMNFGFTTGNGLALIVGGSVIALLAATPAVTLPVLGTVRSWQLAADADAGGPARPDRRGAGVHPAGTGPPRRRRAGCAAVREVAAYVVSCRAAYGLMIVAIALKTVLSFGQAAWGPVFYIRTFGWSPVRYGLVRGAIVLVLGPVGAAFGGWLAERLAARGRDDANMRVVLYSSFLVMPLSILFPLMPRADLSILVGALLYFTASWVRGPQNAAMQVITPNRMRGQVTALFLFSFNIIGFGLGPLIVPLFTDYVFANEAAIGWSLASVAAIIGPLVVVTILLSRAPMPRAWWRRGRGIRA